MNFYKFKTRCQISQMMSTINVCLFTLKILWFGVFSFYHGEPLLQTTNHTCGLALTAPSYVIAHLFGHSLLTSDNFIVLVSHQF